MDNSQIKKRARENFFANYWPCVGVMLLGTAISLLLNLIPFIGWLLFILLSLPIMVGTAIAAMSIYNGTKPQVGMIFLPFSRYGRVIGGMLWMYLWLFLWGLIFIAVFIPVFIISSLTVYPFYSGFSGMVGIGNAPVAVFLICISFVGLVPLIIKTLSYYCTPYILGLFPNVQATDALDLSKKMMEGNKGRLFLMMLSFIGWVLIPLAVSIVFMIASPITVFLWYPVFMVVFYCIWIFFAGPYYMSSLAGFFDNVKNCALQNGVVTVGMLEGRESVNGAARPSNQG